MITDVQSGIQLQCRRRNASCTTPGQRLSQRGDNDLDGTRLNLHKRTCLGLSARAMESKMVEARQAGRVTLIRRVDGKVQATKVDRREELRTDMLMTDETGNCHPLTTDGGTVLISQETDGLQVKVRKQPKVWEQPRLDQLAQDQEYRWGLRTIRLIL